MSQNIDSNDPAQTVPEDLEILDAKAVGERLGLKASRVKQLVRDGYLVGFFEDGAWRVPADLLVDLDSPLGREPSSVNLLAKLQRSQVLAEDQEPLPEATQVPIWSLQGTVTLLRDAGYSDQEVLRWLFAEDSGLGTTPIAALCKGMRHRVNAIASALGW